MNRTILAAAAAITILALSGCGGAGEAASTPTTVTVTKPAPAPVTVTDAQPVEVVREVAPQSCLDALDAADLVATDTGAFGQIMVDEITMFPKVLMAGIRQDADAIRGYTTKQQAINTRLENLNDRLAPHADAYRSFRDECKAASN